ncbi:hypothetical protein HII31_07477, partial [Pseudocercospora fuligena]
YSRHRDSVRRDPRQSNLERILTNRRRAESSLRSAASSSFRSRSSAESDVAAAKRPPQTHARIKVRHMRSRHRFVLSRAKHCPRELAAQTVRYLTAKSDAGRIDPAGLFRRWFRDFHALLAQEFVPSAFESSARHSSSMVSRDVHSSERRISTKTKVLWDCADLAKESTTGKTLFLIPPISIALAPEAQTPAEGMLGTLLHECVHLFINIYSCSRRHRRTCRQMKCRETMHRMIGDNGHGVAFLQIASHVEALAMRKLGISLELGIEDAIEIDFEEYEFLLTPREISRCHPDCQQMLILHGDRAAEVQRRIEELMTGQFQYIAPPTWPSLKRAWRKMCFNDRFRDVPVECIPWEKVLRER